MIEWTEFFATNYNLISRNKEETDFNKQFGQLAKIKLWALKVYKFYMAKGKIPHLKTNIQEKKEETSSKNNFV